MSARRSGSQPPDEAVGAVETPHAVDDAAVGFATTLIDWQRAHGRQTLPWQQLDGARDAYRIWLAEIMLQQTQVAAVVPYYRRFVERFPDVDALAAASIDDVMHAWSGLGYYSRARNLHAAARRVVDDFDGRFPDTVDALASLPGIGRSTAGAIAAFAYGVRAPILDGNVKRVLARVFAIDGAPSGPAFLRVAWPLAESLLPDADIERYTQGLMDLGATICTPRRPACLLCPFETRCVAHRARREEAYPERAPRRIVPRRRALLVVATRGRRVRVERRPETGIWGGLWSLPEATIDEDVDAVVAALGCGAARGTARREGFVHAFSHYVLEADVLRVDFPEGTETILDDAAASRRWLSLDALDTVGLPTPVRALLKSLADEPVDPPPVRVAAGDRA